MKKRLFLPFLLVFTSPLGLNAALPPLSTNELQAGAEVIVTGKVAVSRVMIHRKPGSSVYFIRLKVEVESTEKGRNLIAESRFLDVRCWRVKSSEGVGPAGHSSIPADGSRFRMWLKKNQDDHWEPLEPNGMVLLDGSKEMEFTEVERANTGENLLIGGVVGAVLLSALGLFYFRRRKVK